MKTSKDQPFVRKYANQEGIPKKGMTFFGLFPKHPCKVYSLFLW